MQVAYSSSELRIYCQRQQKCIPRLGVTPFEFRDESNICRN